ncbi:TonB-dependent receptor domain-containing protein [Aureispira anguillae]|uniref:TonB-dependent receptor n=1 Tax=Aureispira anguillae TaxID=2864201 RepID=A0A915YM60_9BACT|nr:TonB-dependent receptor [Aureispira anguillae]BDS15333.1 TonB-dependent receptor [Aureispira anguillae]
MKYLFLYIALFLSVQSIAQDQPLTFSGMVVNKADEPLIGATVNWQDTTIGAITDIDGWFTIPRLDTIHPYFLEINYVGYETVQVEILPQEDRLKLIVEENTTLDDIVVETKKRSSFTSTLDPLNVENIGTGELRRAACCNLSESFENNATVNINFSDAVTGAKEIEMLGLRGTYTQMLIENRPTFNRLGRAFGLEYIPGTFIEAIQISKGASSVKKGVQGITGQINTELIKPYKAPLLFLNLFANYTGRIELNAQFNYRLTKNWSTGLLMHGNYYGTEIDYNKDSFLDIPKKQQVNIISRWVYKPKSLHFELNVQGILDNRSGGQTLSSFQNVFGQPASRLYQVNSEIRRISAFGKLGYFGFSNPNQSIAIVYDANIHQHNSFFGDKQYTGLQKRFYTNFVFQTNLGNKAHNLSTGLAYDLVDFKEQFVDINNDRTEHLAAVYAEYDFTKKINEEQGSAFGLILGLRTDLIHTSQFTNAYLAPRLNLKYNFTEDMVIRASGGRGVRTANLFIENLKYMPNYKAFTVLETILPEVAWNYGVNFAWNFKLSPKHEGSLNIDVYRTDFENQLVADLDSDPTYTKIQFYNLKGQSFANSILVSYSQDIVKGLEARIAYKFNDVRMTYGSILHEMPLMPQHRGLIHLNYTTPKKEWEFNITLNIIGPQRIPHLHPPYGDDLPAYRLEEYSPTYLRLNAHISKFFKGGWEIYIGGENLTNYTQEQPILGFQDPFGTSTTNNYANFDASSIFAPVFGAQVYAGVKYTFQGKERFAPVSSCSATSAISETPTTEKAWLLEEHQRRIMIKTSSQCGTCEGIMRTALSKADGIEQVNLVVETQILEVIYDPTKIQVAAIRTLIAESGYDADDIPARSTVYQALPACCQKGSGHRDGKPKYTLTTIRIKSSNTCKGCARTIENALYPLKGVQNVFADASNQSIEVQFIQEKISALKIKKTIAKAGYDADHLKANKTNATSCETTSK